VSTLLYCEGSGVLHRTHPLTKLCLLLWATVAAFTLPWEVSLPASLLMIVLSVAIGAGRRVPQLWFATLVPLAVALPILHGLLLHPVDMHLFGLPASRVGLLSAIAIIGRLSFLMAASLLFLATTHPAQLLKAMDAAGFPPGLSYLIASPLLIAKMFAARAAEIRDAQQARGVAMDGSVWSRLKTLPSILVPLVVMGLDEAQSRSSALSARAFRALPRRTVLDAPAVSPQDKWLRAFFIVAALLQGGFALWH
jgi:energy-coupling factor transport system permease protein